VCISQNISKYPKILNDSLVVITPEQLKQTNLIFLEHSKLKETLPLVESKVVLLDSINRSLLKSDSIKSSIIDTCSTTIKNNIKTINDLNSTITDKTKKVKSLRNWTIGSFSLSFGLILLLIFC
jgi:hypothetical protein